MARANSIVVCYNAWQLNKRLPVTFIVQPYIFYIKVRTTVDIITSSEKSMGDVDPYGESSTLKKVFILASNQIDMFMSLIGLHSITEAESRRWPLNMTGHFRRQCPTYDDIRTSLLPSLNANNGSWFIIRPTTQSSSHQQAGRSRNAEGKT